MWDQIAKFALDNAPALINAGASLAGGYMSGQGGQASAKAQQDAANQTSALQRQIYMDQRGLAAPGYMTGGAASNKLAALFGIAPQNYQAAYGGEQRRELERRFSDAAQPRRGTAGAGAFGRRRA
jgi:hypothetical protein